MSRLQSVMASRRNLRINADDFGRDAATNAGIAAAARAGWIDSLSLLPNRDPEARRLLAELLAERPGLRVGVHLSLVEMPFLLPETPRFSREADAPPDFMTFVKWYARGGITREAVYREWKAQIEWACECTGSASPHHLDSHQHLHVLPGIWDVTCRLREEFRVPVLRVPYESLRRSCAHRFPQGLAFQALAWFRQAQARRAGWEPEQFLGFFESTRFTFETYRKPLHQALARGRACELMVHPVAGQGEMRELAGLAAWLRVEAA